MIQDKLALTVSPRYRALWIQSQWQHWQSSVQKLSLAPCLFTSLESKKRRKTHGGDSGKVDSEFCLPEWCASSCGIWMLLARWASTLKEASSTCAEGLLKGLMECSIPKGQLTWHYCENYDPEMNVPKFMPGEIINIGVNDMHVDIGVLKNQVVGFRMLVARSLDDDSDEKQKRAGHDKSTTTRT